MWPIGILFYGLWKFFFKQSWSISVFLINKKGHVDYLNNTTGISVIFSKWINSNFFFRKATIVHSKIQREISHYSQGMMRLVVNKRNLVSFYAPVSKGRGHIVFGLSVCQSFCLSICLSSKTLNIGHIFWMVRDRAFLFHMCVPYDKTLLLVPKCWPCNLDIWPTFQKL
jgi:hypothetical protein